MLIKTALLLTMDTAYLQTTLLLMHKYRTCSFVLILTLLFLNACICKTPGSQGNAGGKKIRNYDITFMPDSAIVGKHKEVILSVKNVVAKDVKHFPERDTSIEITYDLEVTNTNKLGGNYVFINPSNFRLVLNNSKKITHAFYNVLGADAASTTISVGNKFDLPKNTTPVALNLSFDGSIASLKISIR